MQDDLRNTGSHSILTVWICIHVDRTSHEKCLPSSQQVHTHMNLFLTLLSEFGLL